MRPPCYLCVFVFVYLCVCVFPLLTFEWLNQSKLYETWYAYHGTWAHLNGVFHKSLPSVYVSVWVPLLLLGNGSVKRYHSNEYTRNKSRIATGVTFYAVRVVSKESWRLVLPITSCFHFGHSLANLKDLEHLIHRSTRLAQDYRKVMMTVRLGTEGLNVNAWATHGRGGRGELLYYAITAVSCSF
jgi:hypothetical protein